MRSLYICYFGLREPLVQTQVLPYLRLLSRAGMEMNLLTFEPGFPNSWLPQEQRDWQARLSADGIKWFALPYHKRPSAPATVYDIFAGARLAAKLIRQHSIDVLHARSHVPLAMGLLARRWTNCRLIFDLRGLMAEEYVDAGIWKHDSVVFRVIKRLEKAGLRKADQVVVLTNRMRDWLIEQGLANEGKIEVIPCCVDYSHFANPGIKDADQRGSRFELVYAGSVTGRYLLEEMGQFFLSLRAKRPDAFFRILTRASAKEVASRLTAVGLHQADFSVNYVPPDEIHSYLCTADAGIFFLKPTFSQIAASPTKIPEYLASGLPVICNSGTGDLDQLLKENKVGLIVQAFTSQSYDQTVENLLSLVSDDTLSVKCRELAHKHFDLNLVGGVGYRSVYQRIFTALALGEIFTAIS